ncbi:Ppx/GppA phosphatase family protein [Spirosoma endophyticum]|uniref:Exopolyphosphatase / guanosine-5'-triphosphate,3'-diphosphate pyrophosphatase n=1 Tax=Spirosoma endophyticum TaxID=662367 RepID=A0A1I1YR27_9BACT|nr:phosphatase [Spirosoma endophyticum]SFE21772.1 exopolyphosphatase / guanosine-5'-triphosphate,3'-diphosphate pyrophosphatase [Spirosoma endophyticum]
MKQAIIDLGTNTFHLFIAEKSGDTYTTLFRESRVAKIGMAGINQGIIREDGINRALGVLTYFRQVLDQYGVDPKQVIAIGTSAIRVAHNQAEFITRVREATGLSINVISGDQEADYIYQGIRAAGALTGQTGSETSLVIDIGGGSVEFILGNESRVFWKQSFEIGGQRLMERFMPETPVVRQSDRSNPINPGSIRRLNDYFQEQLLPLANAIHQYQPTVLVGSSGSFDTLVDMWFMHTEGHLPDPAQTTFTLPVAEFYRAYELLITKNHDERMQIPGMIELRVDMIVVAVCLIDYVLKTYGISQIKTSTYSLKEGVLASLNS